jgi:hypothetical protein
MKDVAGRDQLAVLRADEVRRNLVQNQANFFRDGHCKCWRHAMVWGE